VGDRKIAVRETVSLVVEFSFGKLVSFSVVSVSEVL
jgi:hypothetical protein